MKKSAGILLYRLKHGTAEVLLIHPGGPYWVRKNLGAWSIPKGENKLNEDPLAAAYREFNEETGSPAPPGALPLTPLKQRKDKWVYAWAVCGDYDPSKLRSNTMEIDWPPHTGRRLTVPEVDKAAWCGYDEARKLILKGQAGFVEELFQTLKQRGEIQDLQPANPAAAVIAEKVN